MNALSLYEHPFSFLTQNVRIATDAANNPWFCAKDVCAVLEIVWCGGSKNLENMPENWFMVGSFPTIKGERETTFLNEAGLYRLAFRSNKPAAENFSNWVCETVLPEIRRTGSFGQVSVKDEIILCKRIDELSLELIQTKNAFRRELLLDRLRRTCNLAKQPMPALELLSQTIDQRDLFAGE